MKHPLPLKVALLVSSVAAMSIAPLGHARDEKILPASICVPTSVNISATRVFYSGGSVVNFTQESSGGVQVARLHCPLVRDNKNQKWDWVYVRVNDNSSSASVTCTGSNYDVWGANAYHSPPRSTGTSFKGLRSLSMGKLSGQHTGGAFHIYCELPGNSGSGKFSAIHSIRLAEKEE